MNIPKELLFEICSYAQFADILSFIKIKKDFYENKNYVIPTIFKTRMEHKINSIGGNSKQLFDFVKRNGGVITGSSIIQIILDENYDSDIDFYAAKQEIFKYYDPVKYGYSTYVYHNPKTIWDHQVEFYTKSGDIISRGESLTDSVSKDDDIWPMSLGHCNSSNTMDVDHCLLRKHVMDMFGIKVIDISAYENDYVGKKLYNYILLKNNSIHSNEQSIKFCMKHIIADFDFDICANGFWFDENDKCHLYIHNLNGILNKVATINNVLSHTCVVQHVYRIHKHENSNIELEQNMTNMAAKIHRRLSKYVDRGFTILNNHDKYTEDCELDISYPQELLKVQIQYYIKIYKSLPQIIKSINDLDCMIKKKVDEDEMGWYEFNNELKAISNIRDEPITYANGKEQIVTINNTFVRVVLHD